MPGSRTGLPATYSRTPLASPPFSLLSPQSLKPRRGRDVPRAISTWTRRDQAQLLLQWPPTLLPSLLPTRTRYGWPPRSTPATNSLDYLLSFSKDFFFGVFTSPLLADRRSMLTPSSIELCVSRGGPSRRRSTSPPVASRRTPTTTPTARAGAPCCSGRQPPPSATPSPPPPSRTFASPLHSSPAVPLMIRTACYPPTPSAGQPVPPDPALKIVPHVSMEWIGITTCPQAARSKAYSA